jgi:hypothetical protein
MNNTIKGILAIALVGGLVYLAYTQSKGKTGKYITIITGTGNAGNAQLLLTFDEKFLKEWAKASKRGMPTFTHEGKTYNTKGGKATK